MLESFASFVVDFQGWKVAAALEVYQGDVALMSFNPHSMAVMQRIAGERLLPGVA